MTEPESKLVACDPVALDALRRDVLGAVGPAHGAGVLYAVGYTEGMMAALGHVQVLSTVAPGRRYIPGCASPLLFDPAGGKAPTRFYGRLRASLEAKQTARADETGCLVSAGYASGWYSELLGQTILVRERECIARGAPECRFEAQPLAAWKAAADPFVAELLPYLDFPALRGRACAALASAQPEYETGDSDEAAGFLFGSLDPSSPAVHIWGPLVILPYSGGADAEQSLQTVLCDSDPGEIRSAVVDLTGARIEALELPGLVHLMQVLESLDIECILVGVSSSQKHALRAGGAPFAETLFECDLSRAIALGFQLAQQGRAA